MSEILTREEVAAFLKIPVRTIDYLVSSGQIPFFRPGKRLVRFKSQRIEQWMQEREGVEYRHKKNKRA